MTYFFSLQKHQAQSLALHKETILLGTKGRYSNSEQLLGPTGSRKQCDIAITAASMDASSPC